MSGREWQPGDVALVRISGRDRLALRVAWPTEDWMSVYDGGLYPRDTNEIRPLVVIDPEDREQVEQLAQRFYDQWSGCDGARDIALQAALRSLIEPPKPDEPTGLGAVVEDSEGRRWVLVRSDESPTCNWWHDGGLGSNDYADISVVRVLSEGVA